jgi:aldoxime dehydratase
MRIMRELQGQLNLSLYHEVSVLKAEDQFYEYINCHPRTGMVNGLS